MPDLFGQDTLEELQWKLGQARLASMAPAQRAHQTDVARRSDPVIGESPEAARLSRVQNPERRPELFDFPQGTPVATPSGLPPEEFERPEDVYRAIGEAVMRRRQMGPIVVPSGTGR